MNETIKRGSLFLVIMFIAAVLSPFVRGDGVTQTIVTPIALNNGFNFMRAISNWNGFDALLILSIILIPGAVYLIWKFTNQEFSTPSRSKFSAKGYQISYHDIYISRKDKGKKQTKLKR